MTQPDLTAKGTVTVHIPREVFEDLEKFQAVERSIFDKLGCPCNSGYAIEYLHHHEFVVQPDLEVLAVQPTRLGIG